MQENKEISALFHLIDDPDEDVFSTVSEKIVSLGRGIIPNLEHLWENTPDEEVQGRIESLIHKLHFRDLTNDFTDWKNSSHDLLQGALLVARYQYPDLSEESILKQIEQLKKDAWLEMNPNLTALEQIKVLNHIFFDIHGFSGNTQNYHAPQNSFINIALETKKANPLMLSI